MGREEKCGHGRIEILYAEQGQMLQIERAARLS